MLLNNNTLDGADNNQAFFSEERGRTRTAYFASQASVREFQVNTSNYSAEYGRAAGGVVNTVTRSGTNHFHGNAFLFDRDNAWGARNPFTQIAQLQSDGTVAAVSVAPTDNRQQWGVAAGGPVRSDRIFWFFTYDQFHRNFPAISRPGNITKFFNYQLTSSDLETLRERLGVPLPSYALQQYQQFVSGLMGETGVVPRTAGQIILFPKLDWQLNDRNHLSLQYNYLRWNSPHGALTQTATSYGIASFGDDHVTDDVLIGRWNTFLTANLMHELRVQYGRDFESEFSTAPSSFEQPFSNNAFGRSPQITLISSGSGLRIGKPPTLDRAALPDERRTQIASTFSYVRGNHTIKLGYDFNHVLDGIDSIYNGNGSYDYSSLLDFASDALAPSRCDANGSAVGTSPCYSYYTQQLGPQAFSFDTNDYAVFVSDEWKVKRRLTLSYGVRYEYEQLPPQNKLLPNPDLPQTNFIPRDRNNYGPRVGAAYDLTGHGNTVLRGGYGIYFGRIINSTIFSAYTETGSPAGQLGYYFRPGDAGAPSFPYIFSGRAVVPEKPTANYFDQNFQNPRIAQAEVSLAQRIARNTEVTVSYLRSTGQDLPNFMDTNIDLATAVPITYTVVDSGHQGPLKQATYSTHLFTQRLNPAYGSITDINSSVGSHYQAMVLKVTHNGGRWLHLRASYTYAHAQDNNQNETTFSDANDVLDPTDLALEYADSNFDVRQRASAGFVLRVPWKLDGWRGALANGYALAPTATAQTGLPFSMHTGGSIPYIRYLNQFGQTEKLTGLAGSINGSGGATWIPAVGRNTYRYPGTYTVDLRASRTIPVSEKTRLELMVQGLQPAEPSERDKHQQSRLRNPGRLQRRHESDPHLGTHLRHGDQQQQHQSLPRAPARTGASAPLLKNGTVLHISRGPGRPVLSYVYARLQKYTQGIGPHAGLQETLGGPLLFRGNSSRQQTLYSHQQVYIQEPGTSCHSPHSGTSECRPSLPHWPSRSRRPFTPRHPVSAPSAARSTTRAALPSRKRPSKSGTRTPASAARLPATIRANMPRHFCSRGITKSSSAHPASVRTTATTWCSRSDRS